MRREPVTDVLIVAHGRPSAPEGPEAGIRRIAADVARRLGGRRVAGATLAMPESLERALDGFGRAPLVYPLFMADGWFVRRELPRRLARAGCNGARILAPFGTHPRLCAMALGVLGDIPGARPRGVLVAAHGSPSNRRPAAAARAFARGLRLGGWARVRCGFVDEAPGIAEAAAGMAGAVCLPFFAQRAGHVAVDLPEALAEGGFDGIVLPPLGEQPGAPALIAGAIEAAGTA